MPVLGELFRTCALMEARRANFFALVWLVAGEGGQAAVSVVVLGACPRKFARNSIE